MQLVGVSVPEEGAVDLIENSSSTELNISTDYLCAGNVIGEMGLLTSTKRNASVICETAVQVTPRDLKNLYSREIKVWER